MHDKVVIWMYDGDVVLIDLVVDGVVAMCMHGGDVALNGMIACTYKYG